MSEKIIFTIFRRILCCTLSSSKQLVGQECSHVANFFFFFFFAQATKKGFGGWRVEGRGLVGLFICVSSNAVDIFNLSLVCECVSAFLFLQSEMGKRVHAVGWGSTRRRTKLLLPCFYLYHQQGGTHDRSARFFFFFFRVIPLRRYATSSAIT